MRKETSAGASDIPTLPMDTERLLAWYRANRRDLPWRRTSDPYRIWLSEIMLQQTRVEAVKPYYARFLEVCPTVNDLAALPEEQLLKLWEGLGYYSRAKNLQKAAKILAEQYGGEMPADYEKIRALPGVGDYTAGAIASIAFGVRVPAVDGNVLRVLARLVGSFADIAAQETKKNFREALSAVVPTDAGDFTQAMIELGATVCVPNGEARCGECPLRESCRANAENLTAILPVRAPKRPRRIEERTVLVIRDGEGVVLHKRPPKGLLAGLFEFPNTEGHLSAGETSDFIRALGAEPLRVEPLGAAKHIFTHVEWNMIGYAVTLSSPIPDTMTAKGYLSVPETALRRDYAIPSAFSAYAADL